MNFIVGLNDHLQNCMGRIVSDQKSLGQLIINPDQPQPTSFLLWRRRRKEIMPTTTAHNIIIVMDIIQSTSVEEELRIFPVDICSTNFNF